MAEATIGVLVNEFIPIITNYVKGSREDHSEFINLVKRIRAALNEIVKQKMDILDKETQGEGEHPALNSIRLQVSQSSSLLDSIEYNIKKEHKAKTIWEPIMSDLARLSTLDKALPQPGDSSVRKPKDPRDNRPENSTMSIYEKEALELKQWMVDENYKHNLVIAICGMVGVGKTTLVRIALDDVMSVIKPKELLAAKEDQEGSEIPDFDKTIWVAAAESEGYMGDPQAEKIATLIENPCKRVAEELQNDLREKKCLIVLDDLQNISGWRWLRGILNESTRVVVTTSSKEIARSVSKDHLIQLELLGQERALQVFCQRAFNQNMFPTDWPESRRDWAEKIVHHCGGLPLAIVAFGDYVKELGQVKNQYWGSLSDNPHFFMEIEDDILKLISQVIKFRIRGLPYHLERILMYFSMYPSGYVFSRNRISRLLVSNQYFTENNNCTQDQDVDKIIFKSLHDRFLLQVADQGMGSATALPSRFWIHNVVRQVVRSLSEKEYFGKSLDRSRDKIDGSNHHHIIVDERGVLENISDPQNLSSVSFLGQRQIPKDLCTKNPGFLLLRILSLRNAKVEDVEDVKNLLLLRYLDLKYTNVKTCRWLKFLEELQTVDLRYTRIKAVPDECLQKLKKLRHLLMGYVPNRTMLLLEETTSDIMNWTSSFVPDELIDPLESGINLVFSGTSRMLAGATVNMKKLQKQNIQTLRAVNAPKDLIDLPEIVDLFVTGIKKRDMKSFWNSLEKLENLISLGLATDFEIEVKGGAQLKRRLQKLHIQGSFPSPFEELLKFESLNELTLSMSGFKENFPIKTISRLSHLLCLKLYNVTKQKRLAFGPDGFEKLTKLVIANMKELELVAIASKIMGTLATVKLCGLPKLSGLIIETVEASEQENQFILKTGKPDSKKQSYSEVPSLKSIFLKNMNDVYIISGPGVYKYNWNKKCYIADARPEKVE